MFAGVPATSSAMCLLLLVCASHGLPSNALGQEGRVEWGQLFSNALTNNIFGDPAKRFVGVYLPPSYDTTQKRYPVVYTLHGYTCRTDQ